MAKIACVAKQFNVWDVNGTLVSNCAFQQWANLLGHQADQVGFTGRGRALKHWINPGNGMLNAFRQKDYFSVLNSYDAVYFSTAGIRPSRRKPPEFMEFQHLTKPFIVGLHSEDDYVAYEPNLRAMADHPKFRGIVVNGIEALELVPIDTKKLLFFPCTLPAYLLKENTEWEPNPVGLLYAGRVINWRLLPILAEMTKCDEFMNEVQGTVEIRGVAPGMGGHVIEEKLATMQPRWDRVEGVFDVINVPETSAMYANRRFFWDVCRIDPNKQYYRRMNLVAVEAIGQGCIPIVSPAFAPGWTHEFAIAFDHRSETGRDLIPKLRAANDSFDTHRERMKEVILDSDWSYEGVKVQFRNLLEQLLN